MGLNEADALNEARAAAWSHLRNMGGIVSRHAKTRGKRFRLLPGMVLAFQTVLLGDWPAWNGQLQWNGQQWMATVVSNLGPRLWVFPFCPSELFPLWCAI